MADIIPVGGNGQTSPFDALRHIDDTYGEYWSARELMPLLGYRAWSRFEDSIDRAQAACHNSGQNSEMHFLTAPSKSTGGRKQSVDRPGLVPLTLAHPKGGDMAEWPDGLRVRQFPA